MRVAWLLEVLRAAGLIVIEMSGWRGRGRALNAVNGLVLHHTATTPAWTDARVGELLRDGRPDLSGPLAQLGLDRLGRFWLITDGRAHHNGYGRWGNDSIGIEAFHTGTAAERWSPAQLQSFLVGSAAIVRHLRFSEGHALGHRETDPTRKVDPAGIDLHQFRRSIATVPGGPVAFTAEQERKLVLMAEMFLDGAPAYGIGPIHTTLARADRNITAIGAELGMPNDKGDLARSEPHRSVKDLLRYDRDVATPEIRRNLRRGSEKVGATGLEGAADPPQEPLGAGGVDTNELARAVVAGLSEDTLAAPFDVDTFADAFVRHLLVRLARAEESGDGTSAV